MGGTCILVSGRHGVMGVVEVCLPPGGVNAPGYKWDVCFGVDALGYKWDVGFGVDACEGVD